MRAGVRDDLPDGAVTGDASADRRDADPVEDLVDRGVWIAGQVITTDGGLGPT